MKSYGIAVVAASIALVQSAAAMAPEKFPDLLVRAAKALGSMLDVAKLLGVEPRQVYLWIAEVEEPAQERRRDLERRLMSAGIVSGA
jgi:hypothetical protein